MKISVEADSLVVSGRHGGAARFEEIAEVAAEKIGKVVYDEVFLIVRQRHGEAIALGELDDGFAAAEQELRKRLAGFPSDWWADAEQAPVGIRKQIWADARLMSAMGGKRTSHCLETVALVTRRVDEQHGDGRGHRIHESTFHRAGANFGLPHLEEGGAERHEQSKPDKKGQSGGPDAS